MHNIHHFPFSIAYADTDAGGITYHARYVEIAERARMKWLVNCIPTNDDIGFVIKKLSIEYKKPLLLGDDFVVQSHVAKFGAASLVIEQNFVRAGEICATQTATVAYIGRDMRPKKIPDGMLSMCNLQSAKCN